MRLVLSGLRCYWLQRLVEEIMKQIRFFRPEPRLIKQRIEDLIGRRYLRREDPMNPNSPYVYVGASCATRCGRLSLTFCGCARDCTVVQVRSWRGRRLTRS
jgi:hypothetical protein